MASTQSPSGVGDLKYVVDFDAHVTEYQSNILPYIEELFDEMLDVGSVDENAFGYKGSFYPTPGYFTPLDTGKAKGKDIRSPEDLRSAMDQLQTNRVILTPSRDLSLGFVHYNELASALANAYNNWLIDTFLDKDERFYGGILIAPQRPNRAAEEIHSRASESGFSSVFLPSGGVSPPLGHESYNPLYEACESTGLPLVMHNSANGFMINYPHHFKGTSRYTDVHVPYHASEHMWHLSTMLTQGVPVRFPDLNFVVQEAGLGWIPYFMRRYDHEYSAQRTGAPLLEKTPSEYIKERFYFTSQPIEGTEDPEYVCEMIKMFEGEDTLMFSSDYPHFDFDNSNELFRLLRTEFDIDVIENIYGKTAMEVFDL